MGIEEDQRQCPGRLDHYKVSEEQKPTKENAWESTVQQRKNQD